MAQKLFSMFAPNCRVEFDEDNDLPKIDVIQETNRGAAIEITAGLDGDIVIIYFDHVIPDDFVSWIATNPLLIQAIQTVTVGAAATIDLEVFDTLQDNETDRGNHVQESLTGSWADYDIPAISGGTFNIGYPFTFKITITLATATDAVKLNLAFGKYNDT